MKFSSLALGLSLSVTASVFASPAYLGNARGVVFQNVSQSRSFELTAGTLGKCDARKADEPAAVHCELQGASLTITGEPGQVNKFPLREVVILTSTLTDNSVAHDFYFVGDWQESRPGADFNDTFRLTLHQRAQFPSRVWGDLAFESYGIQYGVEARLE